MIGPAGPEKHATRESTATSPGPEVPDQGEVDAPNLQPETLIRDGPTLAEASTAPRGKSTTKDVAEGWHPPPDPSPVAAQETVNVAAVASTQPPEPPPRLSHVEFNALQSKCPIELTPFGRLGKHAQHAVASLHHWNDRAMVQDRLKNLVAGHTVDEDVTHLILGTVVCKNTGVRLRMAADSLCGPCGIVGVDVARRMGYDVDSLLPAEARRPPPTDSQGKIKKLLPVERPKRKPIHTVDGSSLLIHGRINGLKVCVNNQHDLEFDVLIADQSVGCDLIMGMPSLAKHEFILNCGRGLAHFRDCSGKLGVFGQGVRQLAKLPTPGDVSVNAVGGVTVDITAAINSADLHLRHSDYRTWLGQRRDRVLARAARTIRSTAAQMRQIYQDLDRQMADVLALTVVRTDGSRRPQYPWVPAACKAACDGDDEPFVGPLSKLPLPRLHGRHAVYDDARWHDKHRRDWMLLARRVENVAQARDDTIADLTDIRRRMEAARNPRSQTTPEFTADELAHASEAEILDLAGVDPANANV